MAQHHLYASCRAAVGDALGLHLRLAGRVVTLAQSFQSYVVVSRAGKSANGRGILSLLCLAAGHGTVLTIEAAGCDAEEAATALARLISTRDEQGVAQPEQQSQCKPETFSCAFEGREGTGPENRERPQAGRSPGSDPSWDSWRRGSVSPQRDRRVKTGNWRVLGRRQSRTST